MKKHKWIAVMVILSLCGCIFCVGCEDIEAEQMEKNIETYVGKQEHSLISFSWWGPDYRHEYTLDALEVFEQQNPDIKVQCNYSAFDGYEENFKQNIVADTIPDLLVVNYNWLYEHTADGTIFMDLQEYDADLFLNSYTEEELDMGKIGDRLVGLPVSTGAQTYYYNKTIFDQYGLQIPTTFNELYEVAEVMRQDGVYPLIGGSKSAYMLCLSYTEQVTGKGMLGRMGELYFSPEDFAVMLSCYQKLVEEGAICRVEQFDKSMLWSQQAAGYFAWISDAASWKEAEEKGNEIVVGPYLRVDPDKAPTWYYKPSQLYCISQKTEHPKETVRLLQYLTTSEEMMQRQGTEKGIPASEIAREHLVGEGKMSSWEYEAFSLFTQYDKTEQMSYFLEDTELINLFWGAANEVSYGQGEVEEVSKRLYQDIHKLLAEKR